MPSESSCKCSETSCSVFEIQGYLLHCFGGAWNRFLVQIFVQICKGYGSLLRFLAVWRILIKGMRAWTETSVYRVAWTEENCILVMWTLLSLQIVLLSYVHSACGWGGAVPYCTGTSMMRSKLLVQNETFLVLPLALEKCTFYAKNHHSSYFAY
jgi:hypothetical protein